MRTIAATNADLAERIRRGEFREDLYYRLDQFRIDVPPLRERREDIPLLAAELCAALAAELRQPVLVPSPEAAQLLASRDWPGNIRELRRALREGLLRADRDGAATIEARHLSLPSEPYEGEEDDPRTLQGATRRFRRELLRQTLEECGQNVTRAAARLDVSRQHLSQLLGELGLRERAQPGSGAHTTRTPASSPRAAGGSQARRAERAQGAPHAKEPPRGTRQAPYPAPAGPTASAAS